MGRKGRRKRRFALLVKLQKVPERLFHRYDRSGNIRGEFLLMLLVGGFKSRAMILSAAPNISVRARRIAS